jgi:hypothetical protein
MNDNDIELRLERLFAGAPVVRAPEVLHEAILADRAAEPAIGGPEAAGRRIGPESGPRWISRGRPARAISALVGLAATFVLCAGLLVIVANRLPSGPASSAAPGTFGPTGSMSTPRYMHAAVLLRDGRVLVVGGWRSYTGGGLATAELYDPKTGRFTATGSMARSRAYPTATLLPDGRVLVTGGDLMRSEADSSAELYDPATGKFSATGSMAVARAGETATLLADGRVLIAGGTNKEQGALASAELYDPATGRFSPTGSMTQARLLHTATPLRDGRVLIAGGENGSVAALDSAELYDPATGEFSPTGSMIDARGSARLSALLVDGRVLVMGGMNEIGGDLAGAELYDPSRGSFSPAGTMSRARTSHSATLLPTGRVLIAGGMMVTEPDAGAFFSIHASAELYDPTTGGFSATGSMGSPRDGHSATLLQDGRVLIAGGRTIYESSDGSGLDVSLTASAELYWPEGPASAESASP